MTNLGSTAVAERPLETDWRETEPSARAIPTAELVECNCPDVCDRDHDTD
jgi:hypothetical protein